ncbi:MAG: hypothetical protein SGPRY_002668 [Prymnesium sp.]
MGSGVYGQGVREQRGGVSGLVGHEERYGSVKRGGGMGVVSRAHLYAARLAHLCAARLAHLCAARLLRDDHGGREERRRQDGCGGVEGGGGGEEEGEPRAQQAAPQRGAASRQLSRPRAEQTRGCEAG